METTVPSDEYNVEFAAGSVKAAISAANAKSGDLWMVPIDKLIAPAGFNVRVQNDAREARIEEVTESILANGFYRHMPLKGYVGKEDNEQFIYIVGGFTRLEAAKRAIKRGAPIENLPVVLTPQGTSMADLTLGIAMDNTGQPLSPYERGTVAKRLVTFGWDEKQIAEGMTRTVNYIRELLYLHSLPNAIQQMVINDQVSAGHACHMAHTHGPAGAVKLLSEALAEVEPGETVASDSPEGQEIDGGGTPAPAAARRVTPGQTGPSKKIVLGAIDYALALPGNGIEFLSRWRKGEKDAVAEVELSLKKPKAAKATKKPRKAKANGIALSDVETAAAAEITKEADRQKALEGVDL